MVSDLTNLTNVTGLYGMALFMNSVTGGLFWGLIFVAIFVILVINLRGYGVDRAMVGASFPCLLASIIFWRIYLLSVMFPVLFALILAGTAFYIRFSEQQG